MTDETTPKEPAASIDKQLDTTSFWINDTTGNPSMSATFAIISFTITTAVYVVSIFEKIGTVNIRPFDAGAASAYLIPTLSLYFGRRWTTAVSGK